MRRHGARKAPAGRARAPCRHRSGRAAAWPSGPSRARYTVKVNRKARRRALRAALSLHAERGTIAALDASTFDTPSTKAAAATLRDLDGEGSVLVVLADGEETCAKSFRNLDGLSVLHVEDVGVADVVGAGRLVVSDGALRRLTEKAAAR